MFRLRVEGPGRGGPNHSRTVPPERETLRVCRMPEELFQQGQPEGAHDGPQRGKTFRLLHLRVGLPPETEPAGARAVPLGQPAVPVRSLSEVVQG